MSAMKTSDVIAHFGSAAEAARRLGVTHQAVYKWGDAVPPLRQYQIEALTGGALRAERPAPTDKSAAA